MKAFERKAAAGHSEMRGSMQEIIQEYGRIMLSVIAGVLVIAIIGYTFVCIAEYIENFCRQLMGG